MLRASGGVAPLEILAGDWAFATLPDASENSHKLAWVTDRPGCAGFMFSDGTNWRMPQRRIETYGGTTNGSGDFAGVYAPEFQTVPNVQPVTYPAADGTTRVRVSASSTAGFTVRTERNATVNLLGVDILGLATSAVASVPVRVLVTETT